MTQGAFLSLNYEFYFEYLSSIFEASSAIFFLCFEIALCFLILFDVECIIESINSFEHLCVFIFCILQLPEWVIDDVFLVFDSL